MLQAALFDQDGVIIDTERSGHRVAFNSAFARLGHADVVWDEELYHRLLQVGGGKERIRFYFENIYPGANRPTDMDAFVSEMHRVKTDIFLELLPSLPLRPGVLRFMRELRDMGVRMGICTTSNERVAKMVAGELLAEIPFDVIVAGDMVARKKPDPEVYLTALGTMNVRPGACLVVEDSHIGVRAGTSAGCRVLATYNGYTEGEDLSAADFIASCLGDPDGERAVMKKESCPVTENGAVSAQLIKRCFDNAAET